MNTVNLIEGLNNLHVISVFTAEYGQKEGLARSKKYLETEKLLNKGKTKRTPTKRLEKYLDDNFPTPYSFRGENRSGNLDIRRKKSFYITESWGAKNGSYYLYDFEGFSNGYDCNEQVFVLRSDEGNTYKICEYTLAEWFGHKVERKRNLLEEA